MVCLACIKVSDKECLSFDAAYARLNNKTYLANMVYYITLHETSDCSLEVINTG